jgi:hypothetical protein
MICRPQQSAASLTGLHIGNMNSGVQVQQVVQCVSYNECTPAHMQLSSAEISARRCNSHATGPFLSTDSSIEYL